MWEIFEWDELYLEMLFVNTRKQAGFARIDIPASLRISPLAGI